MDSLPNELLLLIADKCDLPARKSLAAVNFDLRVRVWSKLPLLCAHRHKYMHVVAQINLIEYILINAPKSRNIEYGTITLRSHNRLGVQANACYSSYNINNRNMRSRTFWIVCIVAKNNNFCIIMDNNKIHRNIYILNNIYKHMSVFVSNKCTIDTAVRHLCGCCNKVIIMDKN